MNTYCTSSFAIKTHMPCSIRCFCRCKTLFPTQICIRPQTASFFMRHMPAGLLGCMWQRRCSWQLARRLVTRSGCHPHSQQTSPFVFKRLPSTGSLSFQLRARWRVVADFLLEFYWSFSFAIWKTFFKTPFCKLLLKNQVFVTILFCEFTKFQSKLLIKKLLIKKAFK